MEFSGRFLKEELGVKKAMINTGENSDPNSQLLTSLLTHRPLLGSHNDYENDGTQLCINQVFDPNQNSF